MTVPLYKGKVDPSILVAADIAGIDEIYQIGGAQAIGALAFGTKRIRPVNKICGPGNIYVSSASGTGAFRSQYPRVSSPNHCAFNLDFRFCIFTRIWIPYI